MCWIQIFTDIPLINQTLCVTVMFIHYGSLF